VQVAATDIFTSVLAGLIETTLNIGAVIQNIHASDFVLLTYLVSLGFVKKLSELTLRRQFDTKQGDC
jgi:hypothetical protein